MNIADIPEDLAKAIWWILQKIKKEYLATPSEEQILYKFVPGEVVIAGRPRTTPSSEDQKLALSALPCQNHLLRSKKQRYKRTE